VLGTPSLTLGQAEGEPGHEEGDSDADEPGTNHTSGLVVDGDLLAVGQRLGLAVVEEVQPQDAGDDADGGTQNELPPRRLLLESLEDCDAVMHVIDALVEGVLSLVEHADGDLVAVDLAGEGVDLLSQFADLARRASEQVLEARVDALEFLLVHLGDDRIGLARGVDGAESSRQTAELGLHLSHALVGQGGAVLGALQLLDVVLRGGQLPLDRFDGRLGAVDAFVQACCRCCACLDMCGETLVEHVHRDAGLRLVVGHGVFSLSCGRAGAAPLNGCGHCPCRPQSGTATRNTSMNYSGLPSPGRSLPITNQCMRYAL